MKKVFTLLFVILAVSILTVGLFSIEASAATSGTTGQCTWALDGTVLTISGNGKMADSLEGGTPWDDSITEVIIEDGVTSISAFAFDWCTSLTTVTIPDSVTSIGDCAFSRTAWLNAQPDGLVYAGKVFYCVKGPRFSDVILKEGTLGIAGYAFYGTELTSITIPNSVKNIGYMAFYNCKNLISVQYGGTKEDRANIADLGGNDPLTNATWHYKACENHNISAWRQTKAPTCTAVGTEQRTCSKCEYTETRDIPASHKFSDWVTTSYPTETNPGVEMRVCSVCQKTETQKIPATGAKPNATTTKTPTTTTQVPVTTTLPLSDPPRETLESPKPEETPETSKTTPETSDKIPENEKKETSVVTIVIISVVSTIAVLGGGGAAAWYFLIFKKKV